VAHEKIAADLAFDLKLPVPPVILWDRGPVNPGEERYVSISCLAFVPAFTWAQIQSNPGLAQRLAYGISKAASAMVVFDTWVGNTDRANATNLLAQEDDKEVPPIIRVAYIDYANSLSHGWMGTNRAWEKHMLPSCYPSDVVPNMDAMQEMVSRIEGLHDDAITQIVNRVPNEFLEQERRDVILQGLFHRRSALRECLEKTYRSI